MKVNHVAVRLYEAYNRHDPSAVAQLYDTAAVHEEIAQGKERHGADAIADGLRQFFTWFPDAHWASRSHIVDPGGLIAVTYLLTATLRAPMGPIPACGQSLSLRGVHVLHVDGDLIHRSEDYWDIATFQRQMNDTGKGEAR